MNGKVKRIVGKVLATGPRRDLASMIDGYVLCARAEGKSKNYISLVTASVRFLATYLKENGLPTDVSEIGAEHIRGFVIHLQSTSRFAVHPFAKPQWAGLSGHTVNAYLRSLRAFWSWLQNEVMIERNPFSQVKIPKAPDKVMPTLSDSQLQALFAQADTSSPEGYRNYTMMLLLLDSMVRVSELIGARMEDLNLESRCLRIWGKGGKERLVPFGRITQKALWKYTSLYRPEPRIPQHDVVFLTADGSPMTKNRIEVILKAWGNKAGIKGVRVSPHTLRHTGAVTFLRNGGDLFTLQRIMGHSSLEVLRRYVHLSQSDLNRVHATASPVDNLGLTEPREGKRGTTRF